MSTAPTAPTAQQARQADDHFREVSFEIQALAQKYITKVGSGDCDGGAAASGWTAHICSWDYHTDAVVQSNSTSHNAGLWHRP